MGFFGLMAFLLLLKVCVQVSIETDYSSDYSSKDTFLSQDVVREKKTIGSVDTTSNGNSVLNPNYKSNDQVTESSRSASPPQTKSAISDSMGKPNVIFAMADDLGWGDVEYNSGNARTPNLNKMAQSPNAVLLQRHYSGGPVCTPTRGTVLTGRNHNRYCIWDVNAGHQTIDQVTPEKMALPFSEITVAEVMRKVGYSTALFGKWHLGDFKVLKGGNKK